ncbi:MAG: cytochrome c biogenesis protein CcsA [Opitutaceae bacterium]|jgi:ABC-type transport system involved in cytochrome c biogenesis permease subunit
MRKDLPLAVSLLALIWVGSTFVPRGNPARFDLDGFGRLPVLMDGRLKPLDTVARTGLLMLQGRQLVRDPAGQPVPPVAWLLDVFYRPSLADTYPVFRIDHPDVLSLFGLGSGDGDAGVRFPFSKLAPKLAELDRQADLATPVEAAVRTPFQRAVVELRDHVAYYARLKFSLEPPDAADFSAIVNDANQLAADRASIEAMRNYSLLRILPPDEAPGSPEQWQSTGHALLASSGPGPSLQRIRLLAGIGKAWRDQDSDSFNAQLGLYRADISAQFGGVVRKCSWEAYFNAVDPFTTSMVLYLLAFLLAAASWLRWQDPLGRSALRLMDFGFLLATAGILARMWLEDRPPVTNLYSSALFIGWGSVGLCLVLERINRNAVASAAGGLIGFGTLIIAHHLSLSGDTMEMMRAVLDSNFWLSTHVVTVTTGYASTFLAGFLAIIYILRGVLTRSLDRRTADSLARMVYGIVCFATFFSFIGTVLGGIWADQSWGRFWGWDPKENGALIIVLWNAVILHCRWAGLIRQRGLMALAVFGNIVTSWSWFGTNMLGIGLHSYGFTDAAFYGLLTFVATQLVLIGLVLLPAARWRSGAAGNA